MPSPQELKAMTLPQLAALCDQLRRDLVETVAGTGGHLSSNLGIVELTVALHRQFDLTRDKIVWDVGHQCYVHKMLTGRADRMDTLRQEGGLTGFPDPAESETDCFITGHGSTSISAASGFATANTLAGRDDYVVAVIGDGALTGGLAYEGLSNAGRSRDKLIVVLNDNRMSINGNVGYVAHHLARMRARPKYMRAKHNVEWILKHIPLIGGGIYRLLWKIKNRLKTMIYRNSTIYEEMGFYYIGPVDGHDLGALQGALQIAKTVGRPVLLHVETVKGRGYEPAQRQPDRYHGVSGFNAADGALPPAKGCFSTVFGEELTALAQDDGRICAITAAMTDGTGLCGFAERFPDRFFDTGIAEEHAVTFASGLAAAGMLPVFAVYSTFLQRCYDQLLNDTAIMGNHLVLAIDRAGVVPDDGVTHQGIFDVPFLATVPGMTLYAPSCYAEVRLHLKQALYDVTGPAGVRYPKGEESPLAAGFRPDYAPFTFFEAPGADTLLVTYGRLYFEAVEAARALAAEGVSVSILKLNRILPLDLACLDGASPYRRIVFFEESAGGVGERMAASLMARGWRGEFEHQKITPFVGTCKVSSALRRFSLDAAGMRRVILRENGK
jgi:1-deoxy-D-xylulose-5-phosphate synthase